MVFFIDRFKRGVSAPKTMHALLSFACTQELKIALPRAAHGTLFPAKHSTHAVLVQKLDFCSSLGLANDSFNFLQSRSLVLAPFVVAIVHPFTCNSGISSDASLGAFVTCIAGLCSTLAPNAGRRLCTGWGTGLRTENWCRC